MKNYKAKIGLLFLIISGTLIIYISGCGENSTSSGNQSDEDYLMEILNQGTHSGYQNEDDLMFNESYDLDDSCAIGNGPGDNSIDTLYKWGRIVKNVNVNINLTSEGDSLKNVNVTRTINGNFVIIGKVNGVLDTIIKPYTEVINRYVVFKRIAYSSRPRYNWKLYKISMADGKTTSPQVGTDYVEINKVEVYVDNILKHTFNGPDFTQNIFRTKYFDGQIPQVNTNSQVKLKVYTFSKQSEKDIVTWHWARNAFGFHRVPFDMISEIPAGSGWNRIYEKTFTIYSSHITGRFNGFISASTHKSLYDDTLTEFASDLVGIPYAVGQ
jgi:hypothetical protein